MGSLVWGLFMCGLVMGLRFIYWGWVCIWGLLFTSVIWHQVTGVQCLSLILGSDLQVLCLAPGSISRVLGIVHNPSLHLVPDVWGLVGFGCGLRVQSCIWYLKFGCGIQCLSNNGYWLQHQEDIQVEVQ